MHQFVVWAPKAQKVDVQLVGGPSLPLIRGERGYWSVAAKDAKAGDRYFYRIDNVDINLPDPRSACQPEGVHGPSEIIDQASYHWNDSQFTAPALEKAIIYELHIGTFTQQGTFLSAIDRLDYLVELGITHVELLPVNQFPGKHGWGYDGVDLFAPQNSYGRPEDLKKLIDEAHGRGLAMILDVVYNHLGPVGNYLSFFGPYFNESYHTPWGAAVNLDGAGSTETRRFFCDNALMWLRDYHFDALRLDAVHAFLDRSAIHFLEQLADEVNTLESQTGRSLALIAESDLNQPLVVTPQEKNGYGIDAQWSDDFHHALHTVLTGERSGYYADFGTYDQLAKALTSVFVYDGVYSRERGRNHGRPVHALPATRFLGYLQDHDQVGNRARGERSSHLLSTGKIKIGAALVLLAPFVPMLFAGEEWGASTPFQYFTDHEDPEIGRLVTEGRRKEFAAFGWSPEDIPNPQSVETMQTSKLNWNELDASPHRDILAWHKQLIALRRATPEFLDGDLGKVTVEFDSRREFLVLRRASYRVICNMAVASLTCPLPGDSKLVLASDNASLLTDSSIAVPGESVAIVRSSD